MFYFIFIACGSTNPPSPYGATPNPSQLLYHQQELSAFIHYGMNTYTGVEWGSGNEDPNYFNPPNLNTDQWVRTLKDAGFKRIIMIGRHHDGFCLWKSNYTDHQVNESRQFQETSQKLGQSGDVIEEISKSCSKYDMDMGFYLSPWDANSKCYGKEVEYNEYYMNQLTEILGQKKYGNKGKFVEVWMDGAKGTGAADQKYWFVKWFDLIERLQPGAVVFSPYGSTIRWIGTESGKAGDPCWSKLNQKRQRDYYDRTGGDEPEYLNTGDPDGDIWSVGECDVSLTSGWFWKEGKAPKSMEELTDIYFKSVGHGEPLLLNVPPNKDGSMPENFVKRVHEFGQTVRNTFLTNLAFDKEVRATASSERGPEFAAGNVLTNDTSTYWTMNDGEKTGTLEIDFNKLVTFDVISISEHLPLGQRVKKFKIEIHTQTGWSDHANSNSIGAKRLIRSYPVTADKIKFTFLDSYAVPVIESVGAFKAYGSFSMGDGFPAELNEVGYSQFDRIGRWTEKEDTIQNNIKSSSVLYSFTGSMAFISGTTDPNFGTANVFVDDELVGTASFHDPSGHHQRQKIFGTKSLSNGQHVLKVKNLGDKTVAIHGFYFLSNDGAGMFEIESLNYYVQKGGDVTLTVRRVGGTKGQISVTFQTAPDTAVHGRHYEDLTVELQFLDGEESKQVVVHTIKNTEITGNLTFFGQLVDAKNGGIIGFNGTSVITIIEMSLPMKQKATGFGKSFVPLITGVVFAIVVVCSVIFFVVYEKHCKHAAEPTLTSNIYEDGVYTTF